MEPSKEGDAIVDVLDVLLRDGAVVRADVIVSVADVPLIGIKLTAAIAGMETMTAYGLFEEWDVDRRDPAVDRRQYGKPDVRSGDRPELAATADGDDESRRAAEGADSDGENETENESGSKGGA